MPWPGRPAGRPWAALSGCGTTASGPWKGPTQGSGVERTDPVANIAGVGLIGAQRLQYKRGAVGPAAGLGGGCSTDPPPVGRCVCLPSRHHGQRGVGLDHGEPDAGLPVRVRVVPEATRMRFAGLTATGRGRAGP